MTSRTLGHRAPLLWLVLPLMAGIATSKVSEFATVPWLLGAALVAAVSAILSAWRTTRWWAPSTAAAMFLAGSASYALHRARLPEWDSLPPRETRLALRVDRVFLQADARRTTGLATIVRAADQVREVVGQKVYFSLTLRKGNPTPTRSAVVAAIGLLAPLARNPPADTFDGYLDGAGVNFRLKRGQLLATEQPPTRYHAFLERAAARLNGWLSTGVAGKRPDLAAVFRAMMLGQKHELSDEQNAEFMRSGTMHLFAINGLHIGVVALALHALLAVARCPKPVAAVLTLAVLWLDVDTTGASPSAVRAFILVACYEAAVVLRAPANGIAALSAAALAVLLFDPMALFSASFQMSYGVVLAILCFGLPLAEHLAVRLALFQDVPEATWAIWQRGLAALMRWFWPVFGIGLAAALVSTISGPQFFHVWAPGGLFSNLVLVPLAMLVIVAGFASVVAGLVGFVMLGGLFNHAAMVLLIVIEKLIRVGVQVPAAWWTANWRAPWIASVVLASLLAAILVGYSGGWKKPRGSWWPPVAIATLGLIFGVKFG